MRMRSARLAMLGGGGLGVRFRAGAGRAGAGFFFGAVRRHGRRPRASQPYVSMPFAGDDGAVPFSGARCGRAMRGGDGGGQAFCVRTCDGRYFPVAASDKASRAASCNSFCPASETKVFYGSNIDNAAER